MVTKSKRSKKSVSAGSVKRKHPRGDSGKRLLNHDQEFEIMKLVLDKFLWVGLGVMVYGIWRLVEGGMDALLQGLGFIVVGAVVLMLFMALLVKEFEFIE
ncbi:MAG: hypothetical protein ACOC32_00840 [Nanoarchaeota archaeon]